MKAVLARANMENADLSDALMDRAVIVDANLRNAILQRTILTRSDLTNADIYGAVCAWAGGGHFGSTWHQRPLASSPTVLSLPCRLLPP